MRTIINALFLTGLPVLLLSSCEFISTSPTKDSPVQTEEFDISEARDIITEKTKRFTESHITRDTAYLNNIFTADARVYPPGSSVVTGHDAIAQLNTEWVSYGIHEFTEQSMKFYGNKGYLIDEGVYQMRYGDDNTPDSGNYINIWKFDQGEWKIYSNIWNSNSGAEK